MVEKKKTMACGARGEGFPKVVKDIFGGFGKIRGGALLGLRIIRAGGALYCGGGSSWGGE